MNTTQYIRAIFIALIILPGLVSAGGLDLTPILDFVCALKDVFVVVGASLVLLMITYAGVRYVYSADDPGGRKQAISTLVNAIIGGILLMIADAVISLASPSAIGVCP